MLYTETPPDLSAATSKLLAVKTDERTPAKLAFQEADPPVLEETAAPSFCIRDYVFASRSKGIPANWPFTKDSLHLCLKHDIKNPLPPFEFPALVRVRCLVEITGTDQLNAPLTGIEAHSDLLKSRNIYLTKVRPPGIRDDSCLPSDRSDQEKNSPLGDENSKVHPGTSLSRDLHSLTSNLDNSEPVDTAKRLCKRLPVKFGSISGKNRAEDIASDSSMASKVCPVCKAFFSTSNTTLNAHIDQCLSMESNTNEVILGKSPRVNVKPRKKRSMVDIYKTASRCTLDDLDRRSGTNWVMEVALPTTEVVPVTASVTKMISESRDDKRGGDVYVNSKGIKQRIFSNFNNIPLPNKDLELQKHKKDLIACKNGTTRKRKNRPLKHSTNMKLEGQKRELSTSNLQKQLPAIPGGNGKNEKGDESLSELWRNQRQVMNRKSRKFCQSSCSPNPDSSQKPAGDFVERILTRCNMPSKCNQLDLSNANSMRNHRKKLSRSPEDLTHSAERKRAGFLCSTVQSETTTNLPLFYSRSSANVLVLRSSRNHTSWSRRKVEVPTCMSNDSSGMTVAPSENCQSFMNDQMNSTSKNSESIRQMYFHLETNEADAREQIYVYNKFDKHKSNSRTARRRKEFQPPCDVGVLGISKDHGLDLGEKANPLGSCQSAFSECVEMSNAREIMNQLSPSQRDIQESDEKEHPNTIEEEQNSSKRRPTRNKCQMQVEISDSGIHNVGDDIVSLNPTTASGIQINTSSFMEGRHCTFSGNKTNVQFNQEENMQYIHHNCVSSNERGDTIVVREVKDSLPELPNKCQCDAVAVLQCASGLTSHEYMGHEMHSKDSLTPSVCQKATPDKSSTNEHEQSSSPVSTALTVSLSSPSDPKSNRSEVELLKNSVTVHNKLCMAGITENSQGTQGRNIDGRILEAKEALRGDEPSITFNHKPFCCSCKDSLPSESRLLRLNDTTRAAEAQQICNSFTGPRMPSSFTTNQNRTITMASAALESHSFGILPKNLVDSAVTYQGFSSTPCHSISQPPSNSVLRLMGKNLMVVSNEEFVQPQTAISEYSPTGNALSIALASTNNFLNQENFSPRHQLAFTGSSAYFSRSTSIGDGRMRQHSVMAASGGFADCPYSNELVRIQGQQSQQKKPYKRFVSCPAPYVMDKVIVIDDSPERETEFRGLVSPTSTLTPVVSGFNPLLQRQVAWLPSKSQSREVPEVPTPTRFTTYSTG